MKRLLFITIIALAAGAASAQPKMRRSQAAAKQAKQASGQMTRRAQLMFPTTIDMPEDVVWRRDIYREIDLMKDANAGLYYPVEPIGRQLNLFTYVFKLALNGYIPVYEYRLDGNEAFTDSAKVQMKTVLDNYHIFYEESNGKVRVDNSDIPSAEVKSYYLKESAYFDQANSSFHRKVIAICPVMTRDDDFGGEPSKYPLFWVKYSAQYCTTDSALTKEQRRIEAELAKFEQNIFGDQERKDSLDSIAKNDPKAVKAAKKAEKKRNRRSRRSSVGSSTPVSSGSSAPRVTVRRQRH